MKRTLLFNFITILLFSFFYQPVFILGDTIFFDSDGNVIGKERYDKIELNNFKKLTLLLIILEEDAYGGYLLE